MVDEKIVVEGSSNVVSYAYSPIRGVLTIEFKSGGTWEYENVPDKVFQDMKEAPSKGSFVHQRINGYYQGRRIN